MLAGVRWYSGAVVCDLEHRPPGRVLDPHGDPPAGCLDRISCVDHQINKHPSQTDRIRDHRYRFPLELYYEFQPIRQQMTEDGLLLAHQLYKINCPRCSALAACEVEELTDDLRSLLGEIADRRYSFRRRFGLALHQPNMKQYGRQ